MFELHFLYSEKREPGSWKLLQHRDGSLSASTICPSCGQFAHIPEGTGIDEKGYVEGTAVCPHCRLEAKLRLIDWERICDEYDRESCKPS